jgi:hypothetical protein
MIGFVGVAGYTSAVSEPFFPPSEANEFRRGQGKVNGSVTFSFGEHFFPVVLLLLTRLVGTEISPNSVLVG